MSAPACRACGDEHPQGSTCPRTGQSVAVGPCGTRIDRYDVERFVGGGGMGAVYRARHAILGHPVALKLLVARMAESTEFARRFVREAQTAASIGNPHIVRVSDFGSADGRPFLVMELLEGSDLASVIDRRGPLPVDQAVDVVLQILDGLGAAHDAGIVHRDMKPANVFLTTPPGAPAGPKDFPSRGPGQPAAIGVAGSGTCEETFVKILDFGISKVMSARPSEATATLTRTGVVMGTPYYMAPEQARGVREADHRVDLYATAVILYQMLSRALPFQGSSYEDLVVQICTADPTPLSQLAPSVPGPILAAVHRGMAREPSDRWPTAAAFSEALWAAASGSRSRGWQAAPAPIAIAAAAATPSPHAIAPPAVSLGSASAGAPLAPASAGPPPVAPPPSSSTDTLPSRPRGWLLPVALVFLGSTILFAAGAGLWIWSNRSDAPPAPSYAVPPSAQSQVVITPQPPVGLPPAPHRPIEDDDDDDWDDLAQMMAGVPGEANAAADLVPVPPAPAPVGGVGVGEPYVLGSIRAEQLRAAIQRVVSSMNDCRLAGRAERVRVSVIVQIDGSVMLNPYPGGRGDPAAAACVANRFRDAGGLGPQPESSIVYFEVSLAPR